MFRQIEKRVKHNFNRYDIEVLSEEKIYKVFYEEFEKYFLNITLSTNAKEWLIDFIKEEDSIDMKKRMYLKNALKRVFSNKDHLKGLIGEFVLAFFCKKEKIDYLWSLDPKGRTSAEPGIDYTLFTGNMEDYESIKFQVWEAKTTQNSINTRASEIYDFFSVDGSFDENIDTEIHTIQEFFKNEPENNLKRVVDEMPIHVVNRDNKLNIGAGAILTNNSTTTDDTLRKFQECLSDLNKEQRSVYIFIFTHLDRVINDLENRIWKKL